MTNHNADTTTSIKLGGEWGTAGIAHWDNLGAGLAEELVRRVNDALPGSLRWLPRVGEIYYRVMEADSLPELDEIDAIRKRVEEVLWEEVQSGRHPDPVSDEDEEVSL